MNNGYSTCQLTETNLLHWYAKLLHYHPAGQYQLLDQEDIPPFQYGYFQLPSARESSDEEKKSVRVTKIYLTSKLGRQLINASMMYNFSALHYLVTITC